MATALLLKEKQTKMKGNALCLPGPSTSEHTWRGSGGGPAPSRPRSRPRTGDARAAGAGCSQAPPCLPLPARPSPCCLLRAKLQCGSGQSLGNSAS